MVVQSAYNSSCLVFLMASSCSSVDEPGVNKELQQFIGNSKATKVVIVVKFSVEAIKCRINTPPHDF